MSGDNFTRGFGKTRVVLGDVTNRKRGLSLLSGDLGLKSGDGYGKNVGGEDGDSQFKKQVCLGVENLVKEKCKRETKFGVDGSEKGSSPLKDEKNIASDVVKILNESKETLNLLDGDGGDDLVKGDTVLQSVVEVSDASRDSCGSSVSRCTCSGPCEKDCCGIGGKCQDDEGRLSSVVTLVREELATLVCKGNEKDLSVGKLASTDYGSIEWSRLPRAQGSNFRELERCSVLKGDGCANSNAGAEFLKGCSCSFCLKAAYIWSDLHYQDIKGRIAVLKKSQKEANTLVQKNFRGKETDIQGQGNCNKSSKGDSDLTGQWRSLFLRMEDVLGHESNQLQASFLALKDLREDCKMDLEMVNGIPSDKH